MYVNQWQSYQMQNNYHKPDVTDISSVVTAITLDVTKNAAFVKTIIGESK
jgi:hypothetical protein